MAKVYETMTRFARMPGMVIRVWCKADGVANAPDAAVYAVLDGMVERWLSDPGMVVKEPKRADFAAALEALPQVSAYEILDPEGNGLVVYTEWP